MIKRYVLRAAAEGPFDGAFPDDRVRAWTANFPSNAARRMTKLGLMLGAVLRDFPIESDDAVVYATTFGETITLGRYLESFPTASPLHFQTSIHPSAIEQVLINRGCPVRELTPLAGQPGLSAQAALTALLTPGARVLLAGGEEVGAWLRKFDAASDVGFAFALELGDGPREAALGELRWSGERARPGADVPPTVGPEREPAAGSTVPGDLHELFTAVQARQPMRCSSPAGGEISLQWF